LTTLLTALTVVEVVAESASAGDGSAVLDELARIWL